MSLAEHFLKTLQDIRDSVEPHKINVDDAELLCTLRLVEADSGTNYRITEQGRQVLNNYWPSQSTTADKGNPLSSERGSR